MKVWNRRRWALTLGAAVVAGACGQDTTSPEARAPGAGSHIDASVGTTSLTPSRDTYILDGSDNANRGSLDTMRVRTTAGSDEHSIVGFDQTAIANYVGADSLVSATLVFTIKSTHYIRSYQQYLVRVHRMTRDWTELGATWQCPNDVNTSNSTLDCPDGSWSMTGSTLPYAAAATDSSLIDSAQTQVSYNVTADVRAFLGGTPNYGWMLLSPQVAPPSPDVEFWARESASAPVLRLVTAAKPPSGGSCPNEPSGYTAFLKWDAAGLPVGSDENNATSSNMALGKGFASRPAHLLPVTDASDPTGDGKATDSEFYPGLGGGNSPTTMGGWEYDASNKVVPKRQLYVCHILKMLGTSQTSPTADWEFPGVNQKFGFFGVGKPTANTGNDIYYVWNSPFSGPQAYPNNVSDHGSVRIVQQNFIDRSLRPNLTSFSMLAAHIYRFEFVMTLNNPTNNFTFLDSFGTSRTGGDGTLKWWITDLTAGTAPVLVAQFPHPNTPSGDNSGVAWTTSANPRGFYAWKFDPTWGGGSPYTDSSGKKRNDYLRTYLFYASGLN